MPDGGELQQPVPPDLPVPARPTLQKGHDADAHGLPGRPSHRGGRPAPTSRTAETSGTEPGTIVKVVPSSFIIYYYYYYFHFYYFKYYYYSEIGKGVFEMLN